MSLGKLVLNAAIGFGVATILAEAAAFTALWARGAWTHDKLVKLIAVAHDVDLAATHQRLQRAAFSEPAEHYAWEETTQARSVASADLDLRQLAIDKALDHVQQLDPLLEDHYQQHLRLKTSVDQQLQRLREGTRDPALQEVQRELESMPAKMAKDQLVRMLDNRSLEQGVSQQFVIELLKEMPLDKRKKILAEFKGDETDRLHEILREIRRGVPEATLAEQTRRRLQELEASSAPSQRSLGMVPADRTPTQ